jgi:serine phosphatase RsbU (regulator of sigma subunit)
MTKHSTNIKKRLTLGKTNSLTELVIELKNNILANTNREKFITAFIGKHNLPTRNHQYINTDHNPPTLLIENQFQHQIAGCTVLRIFGTFAFRY